MTHAKRRSYNLTLTFAASLLALAAALSGCGKGDVSSASGSSGGSSVGSTTQPQTSCPAGQTLYFGVCIGQAQNFSDQCTQAGGTKITSPGGVDSCKVVRSIYFPGYIGFDYAVYPLPRMKPSQPAATASLNSGYVVNPGDKLTYSGGGKWGTSTKCDTGINDGAKGSGFSNPVDGVAAGLLASDSTEAVLLGNLPMVNSAHVWNINHQGILRFGFNTDSAGGYSQGCVHWDYYDMKLTHCEDSSGNTFPCP